MEDSKFYNTFYRETQDRGLSGWFIRVVHRNLEPSAKEAANINNQAKVLEVGCNIGEHVKYVRHEFSEYLMTDLRDTKPVIQDPRVRFAVADLQNLPFADSSFDRVILTCVLHHLKDAHQGITEIKRVTRNHGVISIQLPCDPGMMYRFAKHIGPNSRWKREKDSFPNYWHYMQHRNHFPGLLAQLLFCFKESKVTIKWWPIKLPSWNLNLVATLQILVKKDNS
jgi:SAM-dependent methyltransferase